MNYYFFRVERKKSGELWSIKYKVVFAHFDLSNIDSSPVVGQL